MRKMYWCLKMAALVLCCLTFTACGKGVTTNPNPFATALDDFYKTIDESFYDNFRDMDDYSISHTSTYLADLDGQGMTGMIAYRAVGDVDHFRVFYMLDGKLKTLDYPGLYFYLNEIGEAPLITMSGGEGAGRLYDIYSLTPEGLVVTSKLWDFLGNEFYYNDEVVSKEEFDVLLRQYNVNDSRFITFARKQRVNVDLGIRDEQEKTYTVEQIQTALQPQFQVGDWGEGNPQVVSVQKVDMDRDNITFESSGISIDLTNSSRYQVIIKYKQNLDDFTLWSEIYNDAEINPFRREGDYTIFTGSYYFNDVDGEPELAFVAC